MTKKTQVAEKFEFRSITYELRWVRCNKSKCTQCPHGPYWYAIVGLFGQKPVTRYVGKKLKGPVAEYYANTYKGDLPV